MDEPDRVIHNPEEVKPMNNNQRRRIERRHEAARQRRHTPPVLPSPQMPTTTISTPNSGTSHHTARANIPLCAICARRAGEVEGEISDRTAPGGSLFYLACLPCADASESLLRRIGFDGLRQQIKRNMQAAACHAN